MPPNPITRASLDAARRLRIDGRRHRRHSAIAARRAFYAAHRAARFAKRF